MATKKVTISSPAAGAELSSPLAIVCVQFHDVTERSATITVGEVRHVVELDGSTGEIRENVTLLEGTNTITASIGESRAEIAVNLAPSRQITITTPVAGTAKNRASVSTRATSFTGTYEGVSCPAGVIAVNGFMQQFAVPGAAGGFDEKVVLRAGANHLAVQIGEFYATREVQGTFTAAKILSTLVWDTDRTDVDMYVKEPSGQSVWYSSRQKAGTLDVDRTQGYGPENYSVGTAGEPLTPGKYAVRVHYYSDRGVGRTEWTVRVITDEGQPSQQRENFYGILDRSLGHSGPGGKGADWNAVCVIEVAANGSVTIAKGSGKKQQTSSKAKGV